MTLWCSTPKECLCLTIMIPGHQQAKRHFEQDAETSAGHKTSTITMVDVLPWLWLVSNEHGATSLALRLTKSTDISLIRVSDTYINSPPRSMSDSSLGCFWPPISSCPLTVWAWQSRNFVFFLTMEETNAWTSQELAVVEKKKKKPSSPVPRFQYSACELERVRVCACIESFHELD